MKLLLDQNLGPSLKRRLADLCPTISHVADFGLEAGEDNLIWQLAARDGFTIVTKDDDFRIRVTLDGYPPKAIMLKIGNCPLREVEDVLRRAWPFIVRLHQDPAAALLLVAPGAAFVLVNTRPAEHT